jgi:hypothetical protein
MGRVQGWPDDPNGFHQTEKPRSPADNCLSCCAVILVAGLIGFVIFALWILPHVHFLTF